MKCVHSRVLFIKAIVSCGTRLSQLSSLWMKGYSVPIRTKATEQYFLVLDVLFIMLYKIVLTFESVDKILQCGNSNESY